MTDASSRRVGPIHRAHTNSSFGFRHLIHPCYPRNPWSFAPTKFRIPKNSAHSVQNPVLSAVQVFCSGSRLGCKRIIGRLFLRRHPFGGAQGQALPLQRQRNGAPRLRSSYGVAGSVVATTHPCYPWWFALQNSCSFACHAVASRLAVVPRLRNEGWLA